MKEISGLEGKMRRTGVIGEMVCRDNRITCAIMETIDVKSKLTNLHMKGFKFFMYIKLPVAYSRLEEE